MHTLSLLFQHLIHTKKTNANQKTPTPKNLFPIQNDTADYRNLAYFTEMSVCGCFVSKPFNLFSFKSPSFLAETTEMLKRQNLRFISTMGGSDNNYSYLNLV